jgi:hypothetical protein
VESGPLVVDGSGAAVGIENVHHLGYLVSINQEQDTRTVSDVPGVY